jgi:gamma-glutamyltranspeptidase
LTIVAYTPTIASMQKRFLPQFVLIFFPIAVFANGGAVASGHPLATKAGYEVLEKGGNAFDAAIAVASTLNVVEPAMSGLGGYGTTLIYDTQRKEMPFHLSVESIKKKMAGRRYLNE